MTKDEIKSQYSMRDIVERYGFVPNRAGFISCPFHQGDHSPSLKVYDHDFHCHACGAHGDIFDFVMLFDGVTFQEAFQALGGTYQKSTFSNQLAIYRARKRQEMRIKSQERERDIEQLNNMLITIYRAYMERSEPYSDMWCDCYNALQYELYKHDVLCGKETR